MSFGSRNTKAPSLVRSSITFFTAALTSSSVKSRSDVAAAVEAAKNGTNCDRGAGSPKHKTTAMAVACAIDRKGCSQTSRGHWLEVPGLVPASGALADFAVASTLMAWAASMFLFSSATSSAVLP